MLCCAEKKTIFDLESAIAAISRNLDTLKVKPDTQWLLTSTGHQLAHN